MQYTYHNNHFPASLNLMTTPLVDVKCCFKFLPYINLVSFRKLSFDGLSQYDSQKMAFPYLIFFQEYPGKSFIGKFTTRFLLNEVKAIFTLYQKLRTTNTFWALFFLMINNNISPSTLFATQSSQSSCHYQSPYSQSPKPPLSPKSPQSSK